MSSPKKYNNKIIEENEDDISEDDGTSNSNMRKSAISNLTENNNTQ